MGIFRRGHDYPDLVVPTEDEPEIVLPKNAEDFPQAELPYEKEWPHRIFGYHGKLDGQYTDTTTVQNPILAYNADLVLSKTRSGKHAPVLDIDYPARLVPSRTPGHFHLYLDMELEWDVYEELLLALAKAGIIQTAYANFSTKRQFSALRWTYEKWCMTKEAKKTIVADLKKMLD